MAGHDPGWNDPPKLSFNSESGLSRPRNQLNKRVPFSLGGPAPNLPPMNSMIPSMAAPPSVNCPMPKTAPEAPKGTPKVTCEVSLEMVTEAFGELLRKNPEMGPDSIENIEKRLGVMSAMWREGKLNEDVRERTFRLAEALKTDAKAADAIHKSLMVDYTGQVSSWIVGIKKLIMHCQAKYDLLNIDKEEITQGDS